MSGIPSSLITVQVEEHRLLHHATTQLQHIHEQLEPINQRRCTEGLLNHFIHDLQHLVHEVNHLPCETLSQLIPSKNAFVKHVRNALIELLLALDQLVAKGRTRRFYKHLSVGQEYLEQALASKRERHNQSPSAETYPDIPRPFFGYLPPHIEQHCATILTSQTILEREQQYLANHDELAPAHYNILLAALDRLCMPVKALCRWLDDTHHFFEEPSLSSYQLQLHLYYVDEQVRKLMALIRTMNTLSCSSTRQARRIGLEITSSLESLLQSCHEIL